MKNNKTSYLLLLLPLILWPLFWSNGWVPYIPTEWTGIDRPDWWSFALTIFIFEWSIFFYLSGRLKKMGEKWESIGLDVTWFRRNKKWLIPYVSLFLILAYFAPGFLYSDNLPSQGQIIPIIPVRSSERLFFVFLSITAGVCEEIMFRGMGMTFLTKLFKNKWFPAVLTSLCFVFIHGPFQGWMWFTQYFVVGMLFAAGFLAPKRPRLEILILIHFTVDASLAAFVP